MRFNLLGAVALSAAAAALAVGCAPKRTATGPTPYDRTVVADCYTVELFTVADIEPPGADVPAEWAAYSGIWGKAAWEGKWCHDLHVMKIEADGSVEVMELHAPYEPWGKPATAFRRQGRITDEGRLRIRYSGVVVEYWVQNGRLYGLRKEGGGSMRIALQPGSNSGLGS